MSNDHDQLRQNVQAVYGNLISKPRPSCCGGPSPQSKIAADYEKTPTDGLPADLVDSSFGCGNPLAFSGVNPGDTVLDLGSGAGLDLLIAAKAVGPAGRVIGVDMTDEMIARARENIARAGHDNVEVRKGLIEALPVESNSVDWVVSNCVLSLSPEKDRVFAEIARVLKPGGKLLISDIVVESMPDWLRGNVAAIASCVGGAVPEGEYLEGLRRAGLGGVDVRSRNVYGVDQLLALVGGDYSDIRDLFAKSGVTVSDEMIRGVAATMAGKVWSAYFYAEKPQLA